MSLRFFASVLIGSAAVTFASLAIAAENAPERRIGVCLSVENSPKRPGERAWGLSVDTAVSNYFGSLENRVVPTGAIQTEVIGAPSHGKTVGEGASLSYQPASGYLGADAMTVRVRADGKAYDVAYELHVVARLAEEGTEESPCRRTLWNVDAPSQPEPSVFGVRTTVRESVDDTVGGIVPVGAQLCAGEVPRIPSDGVSNPEWFALAERQGEWSLEPSTISIRSSEFASNVQGARYLIHQVLIEAPDEGAVRAGKVRADSLVRSAEENVVMSPQETLTLRKIGERLALESGKSRWWLQHVIADPSRGEIECLIGDPACTPGERTTQYGIVWAGDLDRDRKSDLVLEWKQPARSGIFLALSKPAGLGPYYLVQGRLKNCR